MTTPNINWDQRNKNQTIVFNGNTNNNTLCPGCIVSLRCDGVTCFCRVTDPVKGNTCTGVVEGFNNWDDDDFHGVCVGDRINFNQTCVWTCDYTKVAA